MTTRRLVSLVSAIAVVLAGTACTGFESGKNITSPTTTAVTLPGGSSTGSMVGTWGTQTDAFTLPAPSSCTNFQWQITSQSDTAVAGSFVATCAGGLAVSATGSGTLNNATTVTLTTTGNALIGGVPICSFTIGGTGTISDGGNTLTIPYNGTTCIGPIQGTQVLHRHTNNPAPPPPPPAPDPTPDPPSSGYGSDMINIHSIQFLNSPTDFPNWSIGSTITGLDIRANGIRIDFAKKDGPGRWPDVFPPGWDEPLQYTLGMALNINGQWYGSTVVEYWYGLDRSGGPPSQYATNWFYDPVRWAPMTYHQPAPGEPIGFFVCEGDCRNNWEGSSSPLRERTNIVVVPMPTDAGAFYSF